jgi:integrase
MARTIRRLSQAQCEKAMPAEINVRPVPLPPNATAVERDGKVSVILEGGQMLDRFPRPLTMRNGKPVIVKRATKYLNDGMGLLLCVSPSPTDPDGVRRSWIFRWRGGEKVGPRRRLKKIGLGSLLTTDLARARELADRCRRQIADGLDPLTVKRGQAAQQKVAALQLKTLRAAIDGYLHAHGGGWSPKYAANWKTSFDHLQPILDLPVASLTRAEVVGALQSYWQDYAVSARRLSRRLAQVLSKATADGWREGANPADWQTLKHSFAKRTTPPKHHDSIPYRDAPAFMERLRAIDGVVARGLELACYTCVRTNEIRTALAEHFNLDADKPTWVVPSHLTKTGKRTGKPHIIPLSTQAVACLRKVELKPGQPVFPIHEHAMKRLMRRITETGVPHGMRSTFRIWSAEQTTVPREICEAVLNHEVLDVVERSYLRTTWLDKRADLLQQYADHLSGNTPTGENVVPLRAGDDRRSAV